MVGITTTTTMMSIITMTKTTVTRVAGRQLGRIAQQRPGGWRRKGHRNERARPHDGSKRGTVQIPCNLRAF